MHYRSFPPNLTYAKIAVEDRLEDRVEDRGRVQIFPHLARATRSGTSPENDSLSEAMEDLGRGARTRYSYDEESLLTACSVGATSSSCELGSASLSMAVSRPRPLRKAP